MQFKWALMGKPTILFLISHNQNEIKDSLFQLNQIKAKNKTSNFQMNNKNQNSNGPIDSDRFS